MKHIRYILVFLSAIVLMAGAARAQDSDTAAKQAIVLDYDTGAVLLAKNADERMTPSSMSKEMTMYRTFQALKQGKITLDTQFPVSAHARSMEGSRTFLNAGSMVRVEDLIRGVIIQSGNDAAVTLAEGIAGTEDAFAQQLNTLAQQLGMKNSHFVNSNGLPNPQHYSTARDLSILAFRMIHDFPEYYHYYSEQDFTYNNIKQGNRNPLLYRNIGADGLKTGHTDDGGYGLMGSGKSGGRRVVLVVNGLTSMQARADEGARLLSWGLKNFENVHLYKAGDVVDKVPVVLGTAEDVQLVVEKDVTVTLPVSVRNDLKVTVSYNSPLDPPVKKGDQLGTLHVVAPRIGSIDVPLVAANDVGRLNFFSRTIAKLKLRMDTKLAKL